MEENTGLTQAIQELRKKIEKDRPEKSSAATGVAKPQAPDKPAKKQKTRAEIEAYRQKKMAEEERKYLDRQKKPAKKKPAKKANATKPSKTPAPRPQVKPDKAPSVKSFRTIEPLHMLHIPGLPDGAYLLISLVKPR